MSVRWGKRNVNFRAWNQNNRKWRSEWISCTFIHHTRYTLQYFWIATNSNYLNQYLADPFIYGTFVCEHIFHPFAVFFSLCYIFPSRIPIRKLYIRTAAVAVVICIDGTTTLYLIYTLFAYTNTKSSQSGAMEHCKQYDWTCHMHTNV